MNTQIQDMLPDISPYADASMWNIHSKDYDQKAKVRQVIHEAMPLEIERREYGEGVKKAGWNASLEAPVIGPIAFVKRNEDGTDGEIVYKW